MSAEVAHLELRVTSDGYVTAENRFGAAAKSAEVFERALNKLEAQQMRAENAAKRASDAAQRAASQDADRWNDAIQKSTARYEREAEAAERAGQRKVAAAEKAAARENEKWNDLTQKAIARYEKEADAAEKAAQRKANAYKNEGVGGGILQGAGLSMLAGGAAGIAASVTGAVIGGAKDFAGDLLKVTREFDKLNASLLTVTGSSAEAGRVFAVLQNFAATTPYNLEQSVNAFVQLKNLGLDATMRSLTAFGNMAAAFGDSMDHMLLAVGDAVMGINRPLKQFGIQAEDAGGKSKKFGAELDTVSFKFRGHTTEVEKSAHAIQDYLIKLSEENFSEAMTNRLHTLDGQLSNVEDNWHRFELAIMQSGLEDSLTGAAEQLADILKTMSEIAKYAVKPTIAGVKGAVAGTIATIPFMGPAALAAYNSYHPGATITDDMMQGETDRLAKHRADLSKVNQEKDLEEYRKLVTHLKTKRELVEEEYAKEKELLDKEVSGNDQLDAKLYAAARKKHDDAIKALDKKDRGKQKEYVFRWGDQDAEMKYNDKLAQDQEREFETIQSGLARQEDAEKASYDKRKAFLSQYIDTQISLGNHVSQMRRDSVVQEMQETEILWDLHLAKVQEIKEKKAKEAVVKEQEFQKRIRGFGEKPLTETQTINRKYAGQQIDLRSAFGDRLDEDRGNPFADDGKLKAQQLYKEKSVALEKQRVREIDEANQQLVLKGAQNSEALFGNLSTAMANSLGKQSQAYKAMFAAQQAFGIASASVSTGIAIANAMKLDFPANIPAYIEAAAQGAKVLAMITSVGYSGAYDKGGDIPAGRFGIVGEYGPEFVRGPATVTGRQQTAQAMAGGGGAGGGGGMQAPQSNNFAFHFDAGTQVDRYLSSTAGQKTLSLHLTKNWRLARAATGAR